MIFKYFQKLDIRNILCAKIPALSVQILTRGGSSPLINLTYIKEPSKYVIET